MLSQDAIFSDAPVQETPLTAVIREFGIAPFDRLGTVDRLLIAYGTLSYLLFILFIMLDNQVTLKVKIISALHNILHLLFLFFSV